MPIDLNGYIQTPFIDEEKPRLNAKSSFMSFKAPLEKTVLENNSCGQKLTASFVACSLAVPRSHCTTTFPVIFG